MSNLIIGVIAVLLTAVVAVAGIWYVGPAFTAATAKARADTLIEQSKQIYAAASSYALDKNVASWNDFVVNYSPPPGLPAPTMDAPISVFDLVENNYLSGSLIHPSLCGTCYLSVPFLNIAMLAEMSAFSEDTAADPSNLGSSSWWCVPLDNVYIYPNRTLFTDMNGVNVIEYDMYASSPDSTCSSSNDYTLASAASDPLVQMCLAINKNAPIPPGLTYAASGLPIITAAIGNSFTYSIPNGGGGAGFASIPGYYNFCYLGNITDWGPPPTLVYVFKD